MVIKPRKINVRMVIKTRKVNESQWSLNPGRLNNQNDDYTEED
jgi:hypothetical protein